MRRIGRLADGWSLSFLTGESGQIASNQVQDYVREAGRDPASVGIEGLINTGPETGPADWVTEVKAWDKMEAYQLAVGV
jgi:alkanesulfonate monooxygenase SsuD/methylene tetrahydromethanopterin reductase-like flavin-dependent oxidoreductase (luciferase family)